MTHRLTLLTKQPVTPDTHLFVFDKPDGYSFAPGQATDMALDRDGWRAEERPFTFTSLPQEGTLQFTIKSYPDHDGVTDRLGRLQEGETVLIGDAWGAIEDSGDGVFVAGGAGVTPFIAILRDKLHRNDTLDGNTLIFSNKTEDDIILREEFEAMPGLRCHWTVTEESGTPFDRGMIDRVMLADFVKANQDACYVCGPEPMIDAVVADLGAIGVPPDRIVTEDLG
jgi:ferredoxin-NADP reductase